jgi:hypothetical protein
MFCSINRAIRKRSAERNGIAWYEYSAHPEGYKTCWVCKDKHASVMTEAMACRYFGHVLEFKIKSTGNEYRPDFWDLKCDNKSFHHQSKTDYCEDNTRNRQFCWYPDLDAAALDHGWKPRGKKKLEVPWTRKDLSSPAEESALPEPVHAHTDENMHFVQRGAKRQRLS